MKIAVTADHILQGEPGMCMKCPIALAVSEAFGVPVAVSTRKIVTQDRPDRPQRKFSSTVEIVEFIKKFDNGLEVQPFTFEIPVEP